MNDKPLQKAFEKFCEDFDFDPEELEALGPILRRAFFLGAVNYSLILEEAAASADEDSDDPLAPELEAEIDAFLDEDGQLDS